MAIFFSAFGLVRKSASYGGEAPGEVFFYDDFLLIPGTMNGNIFITMQPPRGFGEDPDKIYHSPDCAPTHHYLGFYHAADIGIGRRIIMKNYRYFFISSKPFP